jgi:hypothetical protein
LGLTAGQLRALGHSLWGRADRAIELTQIPDGICNGCHCVIWEICLLVVLSLVQLLSSDAAEAIIRVAL